ncbi:hypothetical protein [Aestuariibacter salexigens]|uniref:hypothetical protein n=1 Tax=Aestuariibacter salexigens TaxID=226010 RepID=UPI000408F8C5|nr:hypothetical protein [Aestuariibacter salexigens]
MALLKKETFVRLLFESGLIIFSVMLALFLDEYRVTLKQEAATQKALSNIKQEMQTNLTVLRKWYDYHSQVAVNIDQVLQSDDIPKEDFIKDDEVHYFSVMPQGVVQDLIDDSAWNAFKSTESYANLEFEVMLVLSRVYNLQQSGVKNTLQLILSHFSGNDFLDQEKLKNNLILLRRSFREIASQEAYLISEYDYALKHLEDNNG